MRSYLLHRLVWTVPVLLAISLVTFVLMHLVPGGPWDQHKQLAPSVVENLNRRYNLDKPGWEQYLLFLGGAVRGDLGVSYTNQDRPVAAVILEGLPATATLGVCAVLLALVAGVSVGTLAAVKQNSMVDYVTLTFATVGASVPSIVSGIVLIIVFALGLHWFPTGGWQPPQPAWDALVAGRFGDVGPALWSFVSRAVLPVCALALLPAALLARVTRASVLEVFRQDYVRTARAKGLGEVAIANRHVLKNALIPIITVAGPVAADLVTGSFIVESIFGIPGVGRTFVQGVSARDYALILGSTLFYTVTIVFANLVVDVLYAVVDPRVRYG